MPPSSPDPKLPTIFADLAGWELYAQCDRCWEPVKLYPPAVRRFPLKLRLDSLLTKLKCQRCGHRPDHLFIQRLGRGVEGHADERTPQWMLDRGGAWREVPGTRRGATDKPSPGDLFWTMHKAFKRGKPKMPDGRR
jgi:hypothetical protein